MRWAPPGWPALAAGVMAVALLGCRPPPEQCLPWGGAQSAPELDVGVLDASGAFVTVADGDAVDLLVPPQGGHVLYAAARLRHLSVCRVELAAVVRDPDQNFLVAEERRQVDFPLDDGLGAVPEVTDTANVANVALCPNIGARDVVGAPWQLTVTATSEDGQVASRTHRIVPSCRQVDQAARDRCICECSANYDFGKCP